MPRVDERASCSVVTVDGVINRALAALGASEPLPLLYNDFAIVLGLVYRFAGAAEFAMLALIRGNDHGWTSAQILLLLGAALVLLVVFAVDELRHIDDRP